MIRAWRRYRGGPIGSTHDATRCHELDSVTLEVRRTLLAAGRKIRRAIDTAGSLVAFQFYPNRERDQNDDDNDKLG